MVMDSLRYWKNEMHIDRFRFDLASVFSRNADGSLNWGDAPIFSEIAADPELGRLALIAEPWDVGAYQLGRGSREQLGYQWNARYRDDVRRFVRGDPRGHTRSDASHLWRRQRFVSGQPRRRLPCVPECELHRLPRRFHVVRSGFLQPGRRITGRTVMITRTAWTRTTVGTADTEIKTPASVLALRRKQVKNLCCLLLLSNGIPMFRAGDEFLNTQFGNNNPYNQDNEISWLD